MRTSLKLKSISLGLALATVVAASPVLFAQTDSKSDASPETMETVAQLNNQLMEALKKGDISSIMELYTDDATLMVPGGNTLKGKKEISEYLSKAGSIKTVKMDIVEAGGSGKIIYQVGKATYITNVDGTEKEETNDFVMVLKRQADWDYKISVNSSH